ncbi:hypothetical protein J6590_104164 [Homalodisca vitripennis]|nr:hypothetical protein J6590_104164 [Homalodisca vitripennis]
MLGFSQVYSGSRVVVMYSSSIYYICTMKPGIDDGLVDIQRWKGKNSVLFKCISACTSARYASHNTHNSRCQSADNLPLTLGRYSHTTRTWCGISAPPHLLPLLIPHPYHCTHNPSDHKQPVTSHYPPSIPYLTMLRGHDAASALLHTSSRYSSHTPTTTAHTTLATISNPAPPHLLPLLIPHPYHCTHNPSDHKQPGHDAASAPSTPPPATHPTPLPLTHNLAPQATRNVILPSLHSILPRYRDMMRRQRSSTPPPATHPTPLPLHTQPSDHKQPVTDMMRRHLHTSSTSHPHYTAHNPSDHKQPVTSYYPLYTVSYHATRPWCGVTAPPHLLPLLIPHPYHYCTHNPSDHKQPVTSYYPLYTGHDAASVHLHTSSRYSSHTPTTAHTTLATTSNP